MTAPDRPGGGQLLANGTIGQRFYGTSHPTPDAQADFSLLLTEHPTPGHPWLVQDLEVNAIDYADISRAMGPNGASYGWGWKGTISLKVGVRTLYFRTICFRPDDSVFQADPFFERVGIGFPVRAGEDVLLALTNQSAYQYNAIPAGRPILEIAVSLYGKPL